MESPKLLEFSSFNLKKKRNYQRNVIITNIIAHDFILNKATNVTVYKKMNLTNQSELNTLEIPSFKPFQIQRLYVVGPRVEALC